MGGHPPPVNAASLEPPGKGSPMALRQAPTTLPAMERAFFYQSLHHGEF